MLPNFGLCLLSQDILPHVTCWLLHVETTWEKSVRVSITYDSSSEAAKCGYLVVQMVHLIFADE